MAIATVNPATGATEREFEPHSGEEVERRIARAQDAFKALKDTTFAERAQWLRRAAEILEGEVDETARMLVVEMGKPIGQAEAEVRKSAKGLRFYADHAESFLADEPLDDPAAVGASRAWTRYEPLGVVLAVMPWNFPVWQALRFAAPALAAGNTGLLKHASNVPQTALYLDGLFERAGFPPGAFQALLIGSREVKAVIEDARVKAVTLTGSEPAGSSVAATAGAAIKKSVLELGGSDPFIVLPSADLDAAVETAVRARTINNGQSCIAGKRFIVHTDVYDEFSRRFTEATAALVVGDPLDPKTEVGPLATEAGRDELAELVDDAVAKGARVLTGGGALDRPGWFYAPTVLADLSDDAAIVQEETFGPVAALYRAEDAADAARIANQTRFGLSSAVWTNDADEQEWFIRNLDAGAVFVNGMTVSFPELPFGGVKASGYGRELAAAGIREFTNLKTVWKG
ncbi:NADP-dependent succinic semialdehyde dehydrogenase [Glycomyces sp. TRM65418]|uniref:NADP-dependent succinic semialdehyde dehydrogenase n=1 Tax=Glycomyces sp. TRM65418 TaxID=2867006 RepID=UPI001CE66F05|nr:NADP-dependent succinic semialdehyde dehydrogenase [Glycomyces sp. TRM65418]MCC3765831.1 NADP-dependent succinic semialdehyde dehydrogenase [Glycomyces sp. TRM65418]QZD55417.1 NADP-dependent succinic semialdehyde dehydrogenase [Glycomyces sp. TRM65418]